MNQEWIRSVQNPRIKAVKRLEKAAVRRETGLFVAEGLRELSLALQGGYVIRQLFSCPELMKSDPLYDPTPLLQHPELSLVTEEVYRSMAYRDSTEGILGVLERKERSLQSLTLPPDPLLLVIDRVEKPGNLGAMLRTADAAGVDAVILCDNQTDCFNPNVIRSSLGTLFTLPVVLSSAADTLLFLRQQHITAYAAALSDRSIPYTRPDYRNGTAFLLGSEAEGLSPFWLREADQLVMIPMQGQIDSLNVSVAAALLLFEARRQR